MSETRKYLASLTKCKSTDCPKSKYGVTDKKLIQKVGYCTTCLARHEWEIKKDGLWETYTEFRIYTNMIKEGTATLENMRNALTEIKNIHEYVNADGSIQKWVLEQDTDKLKEELLEDIQKGEKELNEVIEKRKQVYELLKDKEYEIIQKI
jgi:ASC-1-like (ASCH) protein